MTNIALLHLDHKKRAPLGALYKADGIRIILLLPHCIPTGASSGRVRHLVAARNSKVPLLLRTCQQQLTEIINLRKTKNIKLDIPQRLKQTSHMRSLTHLAKRV